MYSKEKIKENITCFDICDWLGVELNRANYILCQKNGEDTPSCKVKENTFYCYSCGAKGDCIGLYMKITNEQNFSLACKEIAIHFKIDCEKLSQRDYSIALKKQRTYKKGEWWSKEFSNMIGFMFENNVCDKKQLEYYQWCIEILSGFEQSIYKFDYLLETKRGYYAEKHIYPKRFRIRKTELLKKLNDGILGFWI